jgi:hypothetical protein
MHGHKTVDGKNIHAIHEIFLWLPGGREENVKKIMFMTRKQKEIPLVWRRDGNIDSHIQQDEHFKKLSHFEHENVIIRQSTNEKM